MIRMASCVLLNALWIDKTKVGVEITNIQKSQSLIPGAVNDFNLHLYNKKMASSFINLRFHVDCSLYVSLTTEFNFETSGRSEIAGKRRHSCSCFLRKTRPASAVL
jgi:hypothetical protein